MTPLTAAFKVPRWFAAGVVYSLQERALRRPTFRLLAELEQSQWSSPAAIEAVQLARLRALLAVAWHHSPWHRRRLETAGFGPGEPERLADLARLPLMTRQDAAAHGNQLVWHGAPGGAYRYNTGGSSGVPLIFYYGRARQAADAATRMRARRWWGVAPGDPEAYLWGAPVELNKTDRVKTLRDRLINQLVLNAFAMSPVRMDAYLDALERFRPRCLYGYASSVALLAAHARARGRRPRLPALRVVCTTGEPLYPHQRELIGAVFGVPVANEYGARDVGLIAHEAPGGVLLQQAETVLLEVLDAQGQPVPTGTTGEAVITGLCSDAQPFIRYRTGDQVQWSPAADPGGRGLPVLAAVAGRSTDFLVRADGTIMHALAGIYVLRAVPGVGEFKLIQHTPTDLEVLVVPDARWTADGAARIEAGLTERFGASLRVTLRLVDAIAPEASGKHRYVVSHVPLADGLDGTMA